MIKLTKFAEERKVKSSAVYKYIERHKDLFAEHITKEGNCSLLDNEAILLLDEVYPLPKPVEVIEDKESRLALIKAQNTIIELQQKLMDKEEELTQALIDNQENTTKMLVLEQMEQTRIDKIEELKIDKEELKADNKRLEEEIIELKSRKLWDRIRNK